jgi:hypothetical protein
MTNAIDRRIARVEARFECKDQSTKRPILWIDSPEDVSRCQRENPGAMIIHWEFGDPTEQRL